MRDAAQDCQATLRTTCVRIDVNSSFKGSGLLIAPSTVLTCAHVVEGAGAIRVLWENQEGDDVECDATLVKVLQDPGDNPYPNLFPYPDLAVLHLSAPLDHPVVWVNVKSKPGPQTSVHGAGYSKDLGAPQVDLYDGVVESWPGPLRQLIVKLKDVKIIHGLSGSAVATEDEAATFAVLTATRDGKAAVGGYAVPLIIIAPAIADVLEANDLHHRSVGKSYADGLTDLKVMTVKTPQNTGVDLMYLLGLLD
jgi:hypothetical protein